MASRRPYAPQVRPREPSGGRPRPGYGTIRRRIEYESGHGLNRSTGLPLVVRLMLGLAVVTLGGVALLAATGGLTRFVAGIGSGVGDAMNSFLGSGEPSSAAPSVLAVDAPFLVAPNEAFTNTPTVTISGRLPAAVIAKAGYRIRLYVSVKGAAPTKVSDTDLPQTSVFTIPGVSLAPGVNEFSATIVDANGGESGRSNAIRFSLDTAPPKTVLGSPKDGATVTGATVDLVGKTQGRSRLVARNEANSRTATANAGGDGTFRLTVPLEPGPNGITLTTTDPAGNTSTLTIGVTRGGGQLDAVLRASAYRFSAAKLPQPLTLTAVVTDPRGAQLAGLTVTFSVSFPGVPVLTQDVLTDATGSARLETTVPKGATVGSGPATVFVTTKDFGTATARTVITITQ